MRPGLAFLPAAVPVVALVGGLPFANRLEPVIFGLPFVLFWFVAWVLATPACLALSAFILHRASGSRSGGRG
jgi:hypothetical protein